MKKQEKPETGRITLNRGGDITVFHVGDRVEIVSGEHKGNIGTITNIGENGGCEVFCPIFNNGDEYVDVWDFNLERFHEDLDDSEDLEVEVSIGEGHTAYSLKKRERTDAEDNPIRGSGERTKYRIAIEELLEKQEAKGLDKYGVPLEQNSTLTNSQRIEHLEEELVDGLMYCEHLKSALKNSGITADDYQRAALRTAQADRLSPDELLTNGVMGLCGESGEVIDLVKKTMFQGHDLDKEKIKLELGDCAWYLAVLAHALGFKLSDVLEANVKKLRERYPYGFDKARSINRKDNKFEEPGSQKD